jgi:hypothetical protein
MAGTDKGPAQVNYIYQLDSDATVFEMSLSIAHGCGSSLYRVKSPNADVANRKFSLALTAFTAGYKLRFHDTLVCEGNRSVVSWVRLVKE